MKQKIDRKLKDVSFSLLQKYRIASAIHNHYGDRKRNFVSVFQLLFQLTNQAIDNPGNTWDIHVTKQVH